MRTFTDTGTEIGKHQRDLGRRSGTGRLAAVVLLVIQTMSAIIGCHSGFFSHWRWPEASCPTCRTDHHQLRSLVITQPFPKLILQVGLEYLKLDFPCFSKDSFGSLSEGQRKSALILPTGDSCSQISHNKQKSNHCNCIQDRAFRGVEIFWAV